MAVFTDNYQVGLKFIYNNEPCSVIESAFTKPGKGQAFTKVKYRNLITGRVLDRTFKIGDKVEIADVKDAKMQFLYQDSDQFIFMDPENYNQIIADKSALGDCINWIIPEALCSITFFNGLPIEVRLENHINLKVTEAEPGVKGDTASSATKLVTIETGVKIKVPLFVKQGDTIKIDTRTGAYLSRV